MTASEQADSAAARYSARAAEYFEHFGSIVATHHQDRELVQSWAAGISGTILDVGSGPGQWSHFLHQLGHTCLGVEPAQDLRNLARQHYPAVTFLDGDAAHLPVETGSIGGILAWYSLIHIEPEHLKDVFDEFSRALQPQGTLLIGMFTASRLLRFDHAVSTAWYWPAPDLKAVLSESGFAVEQQHIRKDPKTRRHAALVAVKR